MRKIFCIATMIVVLYSVYPGDIIRVLSWEGYVTQDDIKEVNRRLVGAGYDITVKLTDSYATGAEQMFTEIRGGKCDISFLTLNYIKMDGEKTSKMLLPVNTSSPRLENYKKLRSELTRIPMGMQGNTPLYIPFGGGAYGIWADMKKVKRQDVPVSVKDLWQDKWKGKLALSKGQIQPNIALVMLAMGKPPYYIDDLLNSGNRDEALKFGQGDAHGMLNSLYEQCASFWDGVPDYSNSDIWLTAGYGLEIATQNASGGKWEFIRFKEGSTVWMDTINFVNTLSGKKLEAAEIFADYFISRSVQERVVKSLSMVAVTKDVSENPLLDSNPDFFNEKMFWPPYSTISKNILQAISDRAMKKNM